MWWILICVSAQLYEITLPFSETLATIEANALSFSENPGNQTATVITDSFADATSAALQAELPECFWDTVRTQDRNTVINEISSYFSIFNYDFSEEPLRLLYNRNNIPMQCWYGESEREDDPNIKDSWSCTAAESHWNEMPFTCDLPDGVTASFDVMTPDEPWGTTFPDLDLSFQFTLDPSSPADSRAAKISRNIAIARIFLMQDKNEKLKSIYDANKKRKEKNETAVNNIFGLSKTWMVFLGILGTFWCGWCCSWTTCCDTFENNTIAKAFEQCNNYDRDETQCLFHPGWWDFLAWFLIALGIMLFMGFNSSVVALSIIMFGYFVYACIATCLYVCLDMQCLEKQLGCSHCMNIFRACGCELTHHRTSEAFKEGELTTKENHDIEMEKLENSSDKNNQDDTDICHDPCPSSAKDFAKTYWFAPNVLPAPLHHRQRNVMMLMCSCFSIFGLVALIIFLVWDIDQYQIYSRVDRTVLVEHVPDWIARGQGLMFTREGEFKDRHWDNAAFNLATVTYCKEHYNDEGIDKYALIQVGQIEEYDIDMSIYNRTEYYEFKHINDWFYRHLRDVRDAEKPVRPINQNPDYIVSSADCRVVAFDQVPDDHKVWLKNEEFTVRELLKVDDYQQYSDISEPLLTEPSMVILRLAPQDYHRYHIPVSGRIVASHWGDGGLALSVNFDAMTSGNLAIYNKRIILYIEADDTDIGTVAVVLIGAVCTGSINLCTPEDPYNCNSNDTMLMGRHVNKGDGFGYYAYGGSTIVLLFEKDKVLINQDIRFASAMPVEHVIQMGTPIARVNRNP